MKKIFIATLESRSFSFKAIGKTRQQAIDALIKGLDTHTRQYNLAPDWFSADSDIGCTDLIIDQAYRDYTPIEDLNND
jgi:hypothetical protein